MSDSEFTREKWANIMEAFALAMESMPYETTEEKSNMQFVQDAFNLLKRTMRDRDYK